jgi:hypothetical protein
MAITISGSGITSANIADGTIVNADINSSAAIDGSKLTGAGKVLQVVNATYSTQLTTTPTSFTNTGLSAAITPSATSSKILILITNSFYATTSNYIFSAIKRSISGGADTFLGNADDGLAVILDNQGDGTSPATLNYLDSPSTTSATTYYNQYKCSHSARAQMSGSMASIILMEIAG